MKKIIIVFFVFYTVSFTLLAFAGKQDTSKIILAKGGKPAATIVLQKNPDTHLKIAGEELRNYVKKICGVKLAIKNDGKKVNGTGIYIGRCALSKKEDFPRSKYDDRYTIHVRNGNIFLNGGRTVNARQATLDFIEKNRKLSNL